MQLSLSRTARLNGIATLQENVFRHLSNVPNEVEPLQQFDGVVNQIHLPPIEALPGRARIVMVVVMPTLTQEECGGERVVPACIGSVESPSALQVT